MRIFAYVLLATVLEATGDSIIRVAINHNSLTIRIILFLVGGTLLTFYGTSLNLAPVEFAVVTGIYIATLFVVFQITNCIFFHTLPTPSILIGGLLIVSGGVVISVWR